MMIVLVFIVFCFLKLYYILGILKRMPAYSLYPWWSPYHCGVEVTAVRVCRRHHRVFLPEVSEVLAARVDAPPAEAACYLCAQLGV